MSKERDKLLGAPLVTAAATSQPVGRFVVITLLIILISGVAVAAYLLGSRSSKPSETAKGPIIQTTKPPARDLFAELAAQKAEDEKATQLKREIAAEAGRIPLANLSDADANDLETGCMGTFTHKKDNILYVSGGTLILRPDQRRLLGSVTDDQFQAFADDDATTIIEGYRIRLAPRGVIEPGFDGHSVAAVLTISKGTRATSYNGTWGFGC